MDQEQKKFKQKLGKKIAQIRAERGMEQSELAAIIDRDKQFINRYERQGANPTAYILLQIANALNVSPNELLDFTNV